MLNPDEKKMLIKVARMYYLEELTQAEIAAKLGVSRPIISKMLQRAKEVGVVEIIIHDDTFQTVDIEHRLTEAFGLSDVLIVQTENMKGEQVRTAMGKQSAAYISKSLKDVAKIGVTWGMSLYHMVQEYPFEDRGPIKVIPLVGGMGNRAVELHSNQIAYEFSKKLGGTCESLYVPAIVETEDLKERLIELPNIAAVLEQGKNVDLAIVGIGSPYDRSTMRDIGYLSQEDVEGLRRQKVIGDIGSRFITADGSLADHPLNKQVIGIELEQLKSIRKVIGIASGVHKADSILATLRGGYVNVLITDEHTAAVLLQKLDS